MIAALDRFLRITDDVSAANRLRVRMIVVIAASFIVMQLINQVSMFFTYGQWSVNHTISVIACLGLAGLIGLLRFTKKFWVFCVAFTALLFSAVYFAALPQGGYEYSTGINTSLVSLIIVGVILNGLINHWKAAIIYTSAALPFLWLLYGMSLKHKPPDADMTAFTAMAYERAFQASLALTLCTLITMLFSHQLFKLFGQLEDNARQARAAEMQTAKYLANMSHEIRTPLNGIIGMSTVLMKTPLSAEQKNYAAIVKTCGEGLVTVINDVLDLSRLDAGKMELLPRAYPLGAQLSALMDLHCPAATAKGLKMDLRLEGALPEQIFADESRLRQILHNLIGNAIKFTKTGGVRLLVRPSDKAGHLSFFVIDSGLGISAEELPHIFNRFEQSASGRYSESAGSGLGLAITDELVRLMGGQITVKSQKGRGTVFQVDLPVMIDAASASQDAA